MAFPHSLQTLTFERVVRSEFSRFDVAKQPADFDLWRLFQSEFGGRDLAKQPSDFDLWTEFQSEFGSRFNSVWSASNLLARNVYRHHSVSVGSKTTLMVALLSQTEACNTNCKKSSKKRFAYISSWNLSAANGMMNLEARCYFYVPSFWGSQGLETLRWW